MTIWFTADFHLGHARVIEHCRRPFACVEEMDDHLLANLNACVKPEDTLYYLGDFCMGVPRSRRIEACREYRRRIQCRHVHLVRGNHDPRGDPDFDQLFASAQDLAEIQIGGRTAVLCHYAMRVWNKSHTSRSFHLYGHDHGTLPELPMVPAFDVGVDCWDFQPLSVDQVIEVIRHKRNGSLASELTIVDGELVQERSA